VSREVGVRAALVCEGVGAVAEAVDVVEDKGYFLEMRGAVGEGDARGDGVEAVAVGGDGGGGPGLAGEAAVGYEYCVAWRGGGLVRNWGWWSGGQGSGSWVSGVGRCGVEG